MVQAHAQGPVDQSPHADFPALPDRAVADERPQRRPLGLVLAPVFVLLALWLWLFYSEGAISGGPSGVAFGADFAMFMGAAQIMGEGNNPYDHALLYRTEKSLLQRQGLPILRDKAIVRVGNPPLFFWSLGPLTRLPFQPAALAWTLVLYALSGAAFLALLRFMGWRRRAIPLLIFMLAPQTFTGPFYGNVVTLVFVGVVFSLALGRRYPYIAGALLTLAWLKPPTALPIALLILLFHAPERKRLFVGFTTTSVVLFAAMVVGPGLGRLPQWVHGLAGYSKDIAGSPDVASFAGLYVRNLPHGARLGIEGLGIAIAVIFTALVWHRYRAMREVPMLAVGWLWFLWFLATPYAHFYDEVLLVVPLLALCGRDGQWVTRREPAIALYLGVLSLLLISAAPWGVQLLWLPLLAMMLCLYRAVKKTRLVLPIQALPATVVQ